MPSEIDINHGLDQEIAAERAKSKVGAKFQQYMHALDSAVDPEAAKVGYNQARSAAFGVAIQ